MGRVIFIGAGPGAADLITVRGAQRLSSADVVLFDALTDPALRDLCAEGALDRRRQARLRRCAPARRAGLRQHEAGRDQCADRRARARVRRGRPPEGRRPEHLRSPRGRARGAARRGHRMRGGARRLGGARRRGRHPAAADAARQRPQRRLRDRDDAARARCVPTRSADTEVFYMGGKQLAALGAPPARRRLAGRHAGQRGVARRLARPAAQRSHDRHRWRRRRSLHAGRPTVDHGRRRCRRGRCRPACRIDRGRSAGRCPARRGATRRSPKIAGCRACRLRPPASQQEPLS